MTLAHLTIRGTKHYIDEYRFLGTRKRKEGAGKMKLIKDIESVGTC